MPRQPNHYMHESRQIHGLVRRKDGLFTPSGRAGRGIYFGRDPIEAIRQFRKWQAQQAEVPAVPVTAFHQVEPGVHQLNKKSTALMDDLDFWEMVKNLILTKPKYVAERTGIEEIGYLQDLRPPTSSNILSGCAFITDASFQNPSNCIPVSAAKVDLSTGLVFSTGPSLLTEAVSP